MAYWEGSPLVGPEGDPEGWKVLTPVKIQGALSDKAVDIDFTVCFFVSRTRRRMLMILAFQLAVAIPVSTATLQTQYERLTALPANSFPMPPGHRFLSWRRSLDKMQAYSKQLR